jgi:hypothetical protein
MEMSDEEIIIGPPIFPTPLQDARRRVKESMELRGAPPLIDEENFRGNDMLSDAYRPDFMGGREEPEKMRQHYLALLAQNPGDLATRFFVLNFYYNLVHYSPDFSENWTAGRRDEFRKDFVDFVRDRPPEQCKGVAEIEWEIVNAGAAREWARAQLLFLLLRQTGQTPSALFHEAYGHFLVQAAFGLYGAEDGSSDRERLSQWSVAIVDKASYSDKRHPDLLSYELNLVMPMIRLGYEKSFDLPPGRSIELLRDAKNELENARDADAEFRPWLSCALARCYMALGEYPQAAMQYRLLVDVVPLHLTLSGVPLADVKYIAKSRLVEALELGGDGAELESFLNSWIKDDPDQLGPREHLAKLNAKRLDYKAAFLNLSEEIPRNPAYDQDWKASLLLAALGTRAQDEERLAEIAQKMAGQREYRFMESILLDYWPTFGLLSSDARNNFSAATRLLFDSSLPGSASDGAAMLAGKAVELQLRASVFDGFANWARNEPRIFEAARSARKEDQLAKFVRRQDYGLMLGAMVGPLVEALTWRSAVLQYLHDWLRAHKRELSARLQKGSLDDRVKDLRNDAVHSHISAAEARELYGICRSWLEALTADR